MPIKDVYANQKPNALLTITDNNAKDIINIKTDGTIEIDDNLPMEAQASTFWQGVVDFLPVDRSEVVDNKIRLIRAYALLKKIRDEGGIQTNEVGEELNRVYADLEGMFY